MKAWAIIIDNRNKGKMEIRDDWGIADRMQEPTKSVDEKWV